MGWGIQGTYDRITGEWAPFSEISIIKDCISYLLHRTVVPPKSKLSI